MTDLEHNLLIEFKFKIKQLISRNERLKQDRDQLNQKIMNLEETIHQLKLENSQLFQKYENLKIAKMLVASGDESKDAKNRIQKLVREIDKCIALLNK